mgnify:CR=1 FL=1
MRRDDWIDESEYPDDDDIAAFGDDSPFDDDPLTIGYVDSKQSQFWTTQRIVAFVVALILLAALVLPALVRFFD